MPTTTDERMTALMRVVLALSAYLIVAINRAEPKLPILYIYVALTVYVVYSAVIYGIGMKQRAATHRTGSFPRWQNWIDIGYYTLLIWLSGSIRSPFFIFYFFPIITAASGSGYKAGLQATVSSSALLYLLGYFSTASDQEVGFDQFLLRPAYLLIFGYIISSLGDSELTSHRRLLLLKDINSLSNPRFGIERTLSTLTERIREFYDADKCVMAMAQWHQMEPHLRRAPREQPEAAMRALSLVPEMHRQLLALPGSQILWKHRTSIVNGNRTTFQMLDPDKGDFSSYVPAQGQESLEALADTLEAEEFFSMPMYHRGTQVGRLFVIGARRGFGAAEAIFLKQAIEYVMPSLDNMLLLDRLASDAAEEERQRIARDLHDSIIQPYIGLRIGLTALSDELQKGGAGPENQAQRLLEMTNLGIEELYGYVTNLKSAGRGNGNLRASIERFVARFSAATTIGVEIEMDDALKLNDRLAAEVFQMISEGLSNIRRHTSATRAAIKIEVRAGHLELQISNEHATHPASFIPRSITERAAALGGSAVVQSQDGNTLVQVTIPL